MNPSPAITFSVNLMPPANEVIGNTTSEVSVGMPYLDPNIRYIISTWLPGLTRSNHVLAEGNSFVAYGQKAVYLRDLYAVGYAPEHRAYLTVVSTE